MLILNCVYCVCVGVLFGFGALSSMIISAHVEIPCDVFEVGGGSGDDIVELVRVKPNVLATPVVTHAAEWVLLLPGVDV